VPTSHPLFDIEAYLEHRGIEYHSTGEKNVSRGWVNIACPFPMCGDPSWHCGINLESKNFSCYHCHAKGGLPKLIVQLEQCSYAEANAIITRYTNPLLGLGDYKGQGGIMEGHGDLVGRNRDLHLPKEAVKEFYPRHLVYLIERGFDPKHLIPHYDLYAAGHLGRYKFRIIIPIYQNHQLVTFTSRDITGQSTMRYKDQPPEEALVPVKHCVYNIDRAGDAILALEGPTDVWRVGDGAVGTFGTQFTVEQAFRIISRRPSRFFALYDNEPQAQARAYELCLKLEGFVQHREVLNMQDFGDPAEMGPADVNRLRKEIGL
jgi:hypothetical protein